MIWGLFPRFKYIYNSLKTVSTYDDLKHIETALQLFIPTHNKVFGQIKEILRIALNTSENPTNAVFDAIDARISDYRKLHDDQLPATETKSREPNPVERVRRRWST